MENEAKIADLEARLKQVERDISDMRGDLKGIDERAREASSDYKLVMSKIDAINDKIDTHNDFHRDQKESKYKMTDIILAAGMVALTIFQIVGHYDPASASPRQQSKPIAQIEQQESHN